MLNPQLPLYSHNQDLLLTHPAERATAAANESHSQLTEGATSAAEKIGSSGTTTAAAAEDERTATEGGGGGTKDVIGRGRGGGEKEVSKLNGSGAGAGRGGKEGKSTRITLSCSRNWNR